MSNRSRFLALAFASADALIELDGSGRVTLALGMGPMPGAGLDPWNGQPFTDLLTPGSADAVREALENIQPGVRSAPIAVRLICGSGQVRRASLRVFRLPDLAPALSCALAYEGQPEAADVQTPQPMLDAAGLLVRARDAMQAAATRGTVSVAFVDVPGLDDTTGPATLRAIDRIQNLLQTASLDGASAARLTADRFALLARTDAIGDLASDVRQAGLVEGLTLDVQSSTVAIQPGVEPLNALRALRFTIEACLKDGGLEHPEAAFADTLKRTVREADRFRAMSRARDFALHYQPIVDLKSGTVQHFEALARFGNAGGPANTILMAEELGLIEQFDLAVVEKAVLKLRQPGNGLIKIAANVSASSLSCDTYVAAVLRMTAAAPLERRRLLIEVTETTALIDIEAANRRLNALRSAGIRICIDDFGTGAASLDYLRQLSVDAVKLDGSLVRDAAASERSRIVLSHMVSLCASLKLTTIAEMIETESMAETMRTLGVDHGQGWHFGRPEAEPNTVIAGQITPRRQGVVEAWG